MECRYLCCNPVIPFYFLGALGQLRRPNSAQASLWSYEWWAQGLHEAEVFSLKTGTAHGGRVIYRGWGRGKEALPLPKPLNRPVEPPACFVSWQCALPHPHPLPRTQGLLPAQDSSQLAFQLILSQVSPGTF